MDVELGLDFDEVRVVCGEVGPLVAELVDEARGGHGHQHRLTVVVAHSAAELLECHVVVLLHSAPQLGHLVRLHEPATDKFNIKYMF